MVNEFDELIERSSQAEKLTKEVSEIVANSDVYQALEKERAIYQGVGAGFHNGTLYFGTTLHINGIDRTAVITSKEINGKRVFVDFGIKSDKGNEIKDGFGLNYRFDFYSDLIQYDWSYESIKEYLFGTPKNIGLKACYNLILEKEKQFMWHAQKGYHETIACDILSSYFVPLFSAKGRTFFNAEKGSGKTQQSNLYAGLAFHAVFSGNITGASTYRIIESVKPTMIVDDFDKIPEEQKISFDQTLRVGYKKGAKAIRTDDKRPMGFDLFSHMVINNIGGLDEVSESRCSKHTLEKCPNEFKAIDIENTLKLWQKERDLLYTNALLHWEEVEDAYNKLDVPELVARERERDAGTLAIAKLVGVFEIVKRYLLENNSRRNDTDSIENDFTFKLLSYLKEQISVKSNGVQKDAKLEMKSQELAEAISEDCITADKGNPSLYKKERTKLATEIGKFLSRMPSAIPKKIRDGYCIYIITYEGVKRLAHSKGLTKALNLDEPVLPIQDTYATLPTEPTEPTEDTLPTESELKKENKIIENNSSSFKEKETTSGASGVQWGETRSGTGEKESLKLGDL